MANLRVWIFDRISESFKLFKNNFLSLVLPLVIYELITLVVISTIFMILLFNFIDLNIIFSWNYKEILFNIFTNSTIITFISIFILLILLYIILITPFYIWTIKWIKQSYDKIKVTPKENIIYGFKNILNSFRVYWYIFAYVALIPCLIFIVWWLLYLYWSLGLGNQIFIGMWIGVIILWVILFLIFSIYRWFKTSFVFSRIIDKDNYSKDEFKYSISITKFNWWRIFWNFILIGIFISIITAIVWWVIEILNYYLNPESLSSLNTNISSYDIDDFIKEFSEFNLFSFILSLLTTFINTILWIFIYVFAYVFYKHLEIENWEILIGDAKSKSNKESEL